MRLSKSVALRYIVDEINDFITKNKDGRRLMEVEFEVDGAIHLKFKQDDKLGKTVENYELNIEEFESTVEGIPVKLDSSLTTAFKMKIRIKEVPSFSM